MKRVVVKKKKVKKIGGVPMDFILMENFFFFFSRRVFDLFPTNRVARVHSL